MELTLYSLPITPVASTEMIFVNGVLQQRGAGNDYQITGLQLLSRWNSPLTASNVLQLIRIII
jgi:hypothetical protein